jgi:valyl-tRNA synthetase
VARFVEMTGAATSNLKLQTSKQVSNPKIEISDCWILSRFNQTIKDVTSNIDNYEFGAAARALYDFIWSEFCDWYIEIAKIRLYGQDEEAKEVVRGVLETILEGTMRLLHPFMPFITEELHSRFTVHDLQFTSIMLEKWPIADEKQINLKAEAEMAVVMEVVRAIRNIRAEFNVQHGKEVDVVIVSQKALNETYLKALAKVGKVTIVDKLAEKPAQSASAVITGLEIYVPLAGLVDFAKEAERLKKEEERLTLEIARLAKLLADDKFTAKAPPEAIESQRIKQKEITEKLHIISARIKDLA